MPNGRIRGNRITDQRTIIQNEHEESADAKRVLIVDENGNPINASNPLPTNATFTGNLSVSLDPHDDGVHLGDKITGDTAEVDAQRRLRTHDAAVLAAVNAVFNKIENPGVLAQETTLQSVLANLVNILTTLNSTLDIRHLTAASDNILIAGTENGQANGTIRYFVNNLRKQILDSADRHRDVIWADFSNRRLRRVVQFDYTSPTFPGVTARRTFNYTLVGNEYRFDGDVWSIVI
jgi:hypothetical protein